MIERPAAVEYSGFNPRYVALVPDCDLLSLLASQSNTLRTLLSRVSPDRELFRYTSDKWSVRDVVGHLSDTERVLGYRALCIARGERNDLPGFDEHAYAAAAGADTRPVAELIEGFTFAREANLHFLRNLPADGWRHVGTANGHPVTVRALAYVMAGHVLHHITILNERYAVI